MVRTRTATGYGPRRLAVYLEGLGLELSPHTIPHIVHRKGLVQRKRRRATVHPVLWAREQTEPFALFQADVKDIREKRALGSGLCDHLAEHWLSH